MLLVREFDSRSGSFVADRSWLRLVVTVAVYSLKTTVRCTALASDNACASIIFHEEGDDGGGGSPLPF